MYGFCLHPTSIECYEPCSECGYWQEVNKQIYDKGISEFLKEKSHIGNGIPSRIPALLINFLNKSEASIDSIMEAMPEDVKKSRVGFHLRILIQKKIIIKVWNGRMTTPLYRLIK